MGRGEKNGENAILPAAIAGPVRAAFAQLLEAREMARSSGRKAWDFAAEINNLTSTGVTATALRWLVCRGYAECSREVTLSGDSERRFEPVANLSLNPQSCFVLSRKGAELAQALMDLTEIASGNGEIQAADATPDGAPEAAGSEEGRNGELIPQWDARRRELRLGTRLLKCFKVPAPNQEAVLSAFQEEGWPSTIDDPLPPKGELEPKRRLHDTIKALNRKHLQRPPVIHFQGNGTGENVVWELRMAAGQARGRKRP
jgi:hypothetical protein